MSDKAIGYLFQGLSVLLYSIAATAFIAVVRALTVTSTLAAIESAFGAMVICLLLAVFARKMWEMGKKKRTGALESKTG